MHIIPPVKRGMQCGWYLPKKVVAILPNFKCRQISGVLPPSEIQVAQLGFSFFYSVCVLLASSSQDMAVIAPPLRTSQTRRAAAVMTYDTAGFSKNMRTEAWVLGIHSSQTLCHTQIQVSPATVSPPGRRRPETRCAGRSRARKRGSSPGAMSSRTRSGVRSAIPPQLDAPGPGGRQCRLTGLRLAP